MVKNSGVMLNFQGVGPYEKLFCNDLGEESLLINCDHQGVHGLDIRNSAGSHRILSRQKVP